MLIDASVARSVAVLGWIEHLAQAVGGSLAIAHGVIGIDTDEPSELRRIRDALEREINTSPHGSGRYSKAVAAVQGLDTLLHLGPPTITLLIPDSDEVRMVLVHVRDLLAQGLPVLGSEADDVLSILVQVSKHHRFSDWRQEEQARNLTLGPDSFALPAAAPPTATPAPPVQLPTWRATPEERRAWQQALQARIERQTAAIQALQAAVGTAEEIVLPHPRDALIQASDAPGSDLEAKAASLADRLLLDTRADGCQTTTRIAQAIETLQGMLFAVRTGQLHDPEGGLEFAAGYLTFDEDWRWLGSYATWRAAMLVFLYPENVLPPSLRNWKSPAFQALINELRSSGRVTPDQACRAIETYADYFRRVCSFNLEATCTAFARARSGDCLDGMTGDRYLFYQGECK
jgi:hypothetical protein